MTFAAVWKYLQAERGKLLIVNLQFKPVKKKEIKGAALASEYNPSLAHEATFATWSPITFQALVTIHRFMTLTCPAAVLCADARRWAISMHGTLQYQTIL